MSPQRNETNSRDKELVDRIVKVPDKMDLVIPVGPGNIDNIKIGPLAPFMPKALVHLGHRPMLWYVLQQVSTIGDQIAKVHLVLTRNPTGVPTWKQVEHFIQKENPPLAGKVKRVEPVEEMDDLTRHIYDLQIESECFLLHYHDILVDEEGYGLYEKLADTHRRAKRRKRRICGTWAVSTEVPEGFRLSSNVPERQDDLRIVRASQKPFHVIRAVPLEADVEGSTGYQLINMGIAVFDTELLHRTKDLPFRRGDFFQRISGLEDTPDKKVDTLVEKRSLFTTCVYRHKWWHLDTYNDLKEQQSNFEFWERLESRRQGSFVNKSVES